MRTLYLLSMLVPLASAVAANQHDSGPNTLAHNTMVVTASNAAANQLLVYNTNGQLIQTLNTQGQGGASGNAGGVTAKGNLVAVVNFGSQNVSVFERGDSGLQMRRLVPAASSPLSVAFGNEHIYILGTTKLESHRMNGSSVSPNPDGVVNLLKADGSAAQVGVLQNQLVVTEKSNVIETIDLINDGSVVGAATLVQNIPANVDTPFGMVTDGIDAYVTIAHADEISLVRNGRVLAVTGSGSQHSPCWLTLVGPYLFSSNSPSKSVSRFVVHGQKITPDEPVAATFSGSPTDIDSGDGLVALIDGSGPLTHLSIFNADKDGDLGLRATATINLAANGVAVVLGDN